MKSDSYKTIKSFSQGSYKDRGSRFIAFAYPVASQEEVKPIIDKMRKEYHDARHHCYAYMLGQQRLIWRINDDGEPSGTAGKPILGQINSFGLTNLLIIVIRYFGGTLLGVSGLIKAYKSAAADAINNAEIVERLLKDYYEITFPYASMNEVMRILKDDEIGQEDQIFDLDCRITIGFRVSVRDMVLEKFSRINGLKLRYIETR